MYIDTQFDSWYALFVVTGEEDNVRERLKYRYLDRFKILVPKRRLRERKGGTWTDITKILFPGYVLVSGNIEEVPYRDLLSIPKIIKPLRSGGEMQRIDRKEMMVLSRLICDSGIIDFSNIIIENSIVRVIDGPLVSMEGIILSIDHRKGRARVRLDFLSDERTVELGVSVLRPVS